jgi:uncharacterized membrane-anchored protein
MKKTYIITAFVITVVMQLSIPIKMIYDSEVTKKEGTEFKFKTVPIDPTDYLRGKYIILSYDIEIHESQDTTFVREDQVYVLLKHGKNGFAEIASLHHEAPENETDYVVAEVQSHYAGRIHLQFPFDRYYMNENKAQDAELAYAEYSKKDAKPAYAVVAVRNGNAVVKDVIIDGVPIKDYVVK